MELQNTVFCGLYGKLNTENLLSQIRNIYGKKFGPVASDKHIVLDNKSVALPLYSTLLYTLPVTI